MPTRSKRSDETGNFRPGRCAFSPAKGDYNGRMLDWISFASEKQFLGVVIVEADTLTGALAAVRNRAAYRPPTRGSQTSLSAEQERLERPVDGQNPHNPQLLFVTVMIPGYYPLLTSPNTVL